MKEVQDRVVQFSNRYKLTDADTGEVLGTFDFDEVTGTVTEAGTEIDKALFDSIAEDFTDIINGTQPVGAVGATQLTNEDIHSLVGAEHWGKTYFAAGGNSVLNKPAGVDGFSLEVLRAGVSTTVHRLTSAADTSGESVSPNIYIEQYITSWSSWEEVATGDGKYLNMTVGKSETLTEPFTVGKDTTAATTGYVKFASVSLPFAYRSATARFEVLDKNPVNAQTNMCGVEVVVRNASETSVTVTAQLLYGSSAYLSKIYACVKKGSYPVLVDLYFDITSSNPQETISCIKPLFTFGRTTVGVEFTFIADNESVSALPTDTTNTQLSTVRVLVTEAADSEKLNGKAASDIFESDGVTAKKATNAQKLGNKAASEYALANDIPNVSNFAEKNGTYSDMTVGNAYKLGNKAASEYALADDLTAHETDINNPHSVTKEQVGLGSVDNTADADKPVSTAQAAAIAGVQGNVDKIVSGETAVGNAEKLNGKAASDIFESDGVTAKKATSLIPDENGAVNPLGRKDGAVVGAKSTALGYNAAASGNESTALGSLAAASGDSSTALGNATASGNESTALGSLAAASRYQSTALGNATASGEYSTALGYNATASGDSSTALGNATASGKSSTALGEGSVARGEYSTALGNATAVGNDSTALGYYATASGKSSTALGQGASAGGYHATALGQGAEVSESDLRVMQLGSNSLSALRCKVNLTVTSDERDKADINTIANALAFIDRLNPVTFVSNDRENYISEEDKRSEKFRKYGMCEYDRIAHAAGAKKGERRRCGLLAQEVIAAMQEVYGTNNYANIVNDNFHDLQEKPSDVENKYTLAYANLVPFLIGAIKELNAKIKILEDKNNV